MYNKFSILFLLFFSLYSFCVDAIPPEPSLDADCATWVDWEENCVSAMPLDAELAVDWIQNCLEAYQRAIRHKEQMGQSCYIRFAPPGSRNLPMAPVQKFGQNRNEYLTQLKEWRPQCEAIFAAFSNPTARERGMQTCKQLYDQAVRTEDVSHVRMIPLPS